MSKGFKRLKKIIKIYIKGISKIVYIFDQHLYLFKDKQLHGKTKLNACFNLSFLFINFNFETHFSSYPSWDLFSKREFSPLLIIEKWELSRRKFSIRGNLIDEICMINFPDLFHLKIEVN